ncbi:hypothetical protein T492DRAFT_1009814, partial [Pavlovales sp. CCMP2436]
RAVNDKSIHDLMPLPLRAEVAEHGFLGDIAVIATRADDLSRAELAHNLGLPEDTPAPVLAAKRREYIQTTMSAAFFRGISKQLWPVNREDDADSSAGAQRFDLPVFVVSAVDYTKLVGVRHNDGESSGLFASPEETDVPALAALIQRRALARTHIAPAATANGGVAGAVTGRTTGARLLAHRKKSERDAEGGDADKEEGGAGPSAPALKPWSRKPWSNSAHHKSQLAPQSVLPAGRAGGSYTAPTPMHLQVKRPSPSKKGSPPLPGVSRGTPGRPGSRPNLARALDTVPPSRPAGRSGPAFMPPPNSIIDLTDD